MYDIEGFKGCSLSASGASIVYIYIRIYTYSLYTHTSCNIMSPSATDYRYIHYASYPNIASTFDLLKSLAPITLWMYVCDLAINAKLFKYIDLGIIKT